MIYPTSFVVILKKKWGYLFTQARVKTGVATWENLKLPFWKGACFYGLEIDLLQMSFSEIFLRKFQTFPVICTRHSCREGYIDGIRRPKQKLAWLRSHTRGGVISFNTRFVKQKNHQKFTLTLVLPKGVWIFPCRPKTKRKVTKPSRWSIQHPSWSFWKKKMGVPLYPG